MRSILFGNPKTWPDYKIGSGFGKFLAKRGKGYGMNYPVLVKTGKPS
jgi:hypothetical protein